MARQTARDIALAQQKRATAKLNRLRRNGVDISSIDPRRSTEGMSTPQLRKYADQLQSFNSNRGYVAGLNGAPIGRAAVDAYRALERRNNRVSEGYEKSVGGVGVPSLGQDIASQISRRDRQKFVAGGEQATFQKYNRNMADITGQTSLQRIIENMRKKVQPGYLTERMQIYRNNLETMLRTTGDDDGIDMVNRLSDQQLNILIDYSPFMSAMSGRYEYQKMMNTDEQFQPENWMTEIFETNAEEVHGLLDWAKDLNPNEYTNTNAGPIPVQKASRDKSATEYTDTTARPIPVQRPKPGNPGRGKPGKSK